MGGICSSCESTSVATAKIILEDGRLQEYPYPVKVSYVLQTMNPTHFICNSDEMDFDDVVSAVRDDDELLPGHLYFALPMSRLKHRLRPEEMAALAVKASSALTKSSDINKISYCQCISTGNTNGVMVFAGESKVVGDGERRRRGRGGVGKRRLARLSAIAE